MNKPVNEFLDELVEEIKVAPKLYYQFEQLQTENKWLNRRIEAIESLLVCYRCGKRPTEKLFKELELTEQALKGGGK